VSRTRWTIEQVEADAARGMVAAKHRLAAEAGADALRAGGNAVDAAVATSFAECVVNPAYTGLGGAGNMVIFLAESAEAVAVEYGGRAPAAARADMYDLLPGSDGGFGWRAVRDDANGYGYRSATVPGTVAGLCLAHQRFGALPRADVIAPAIRLAGDGFEVSFYDALVIGREQHRLREFPASAAIFLRPYRDGWLVPTPEQGHRIVQTDLAATLERVAREGADGFYRGEVAAAIEREMRANGGIMTAADLASYAPRVGRPFVGRLSGHDLLVAPWGNGGVTVLQTLNLLAGLELARAGHNSAEHLHLFAEASRRAFADRFAFVADPESADAPWQGLLSQEYAAARRAEMRPELATPDPGPGDPWAYQESRSGRGATGLDPRADHGTTHMATVDAAGNAVSLTQTLLTGFGSRATVAGTGVVLNNGMMWFDPEPGHANSIAPNKRALSNMAPLIGLRDGRLRFAVGASGGRKIIDCVSQVALNVAEFGLGIQDAISAPRIDCSGRQLLVDDRVDPAIVDALRRRGHRVDVRQEAFGAHLWASPVGVAIDDAGRRRGGVHRLYPAEAVGL
jgi:gamma-glutamyltranspeptidase / glutathione hydrolase